MIVRAWFLCLLVGPCLRERARARHDHVRDLGRTGRAAEIPRRRQSAAQFPVRRSRGRVSRSQSPRPELRARLLGRGHEPQPPALGSTRSRGWPARARVARADARRARRESTIAEGARPARGDRSPVLRPRRQARARPRVLRVFGQLYARWPDDHEISTWYALSLLGTVRPGDTGFRRQALAASIAGKVFAENPRTPARRTSSSTRSTTPIMRRSAW